MKKQPITPIRGYKVTMPNGTSRNGKEVFEVGKEYTYNGTIQIGATGYHFYLKAAHCFAYYSFDSNNKVFEVEARGETQSHDSDSKIVTDRLFIVRQLTWEEVLRVSNDGNNNTGLGNTGDRNTGDRNTGDRNTGDRNTGGWNTGYRNTGYSNTGYSNTGGWNTGDRNTGYRNTGDRNTGGWNTGGWNTGDRNTGYSNTGDRNTGGFCTGDAPFPLFNKPSKWTEKDFIGSQAYTLLCQVDTKMWIPASRMTEEEKAKYPSYETADGYLKDITYKEAFQNAWHNWNTDSRAAFTSLPNFNAKIFLEITGVDVNKK